MRSCAKISAAIHEMIPHDLSRLSCTNNAIAAVVIIHLFTKLTFSDCPEGFTGPGCRYPCNCVDDDCEESGECSPGTKCDVPYFGLACQYVNIIYDESEVLFDHNETTCDVITTELTIILSSNIRLTSYRYVGMNVDDLLNLTFFVRPGLSCGVGVSQHDNITLDGFCKHRVTTALVTVSPSPPGVTLCDIYISSGRLLSPEIVKSYIAGEEQVSIQETYDLNMSTSLTRNVNQKITLSYEFDELHEIFGVRYHCVPPKIFWTYMMLHGLTSTTTYLEEELVSAQFYEHRTVSTPVFSCTPKPPVMKLNQQFMCPKQKNLLVLHEIEVFGDCVMGSYGLGCKLQCAERCAFRQCHVISGFCYQCGVHNFGTRCQKDCSNNCLSINCTQLDGSCKEGCKLGNFGHDCTKVCPYNCASRNCTQYEGSCVDGCKQGYYGHDCGAACTPNCIDRICDPVNGSCTTGCKQNWFGSQCDECAENCKENLCHNMTGVCTEDCPTGLFGPICSKECNPNCGYNTCNRNGKCSKGCKGRYFGAECEQLSNEVKPTAGYSVLLLMVLIIGMCAVGTGILLRWRTRAQVPPSLE